MADKAPVIKRPLGAMISLRCPGCSAQVNVSFRQQFAKCSMCKTQWRWKKEPKRMTLAGNA